MRLRHEQQQQRSHRQRLRRQQYQQQRSLLIYARHFEESPPSTPLVSPILHSGWIRGDFTCLFRLSPAKMPDVTQTGIYGWMYELSVTAWAVFKVYRLL